MSHDKFSYHGDYRVQSSRRPRRSFLAGEWLSFPGADILDAAFVNDLLSRDPRYQGAMRVSLRPALISAAGGDFMTQPDILYKKSHFRPEPGTLAMAFNVIDVRKAVAKWASRQPVVEALIGREQYEVIREYFADDLGQTVSNEYFVHEAGHALGYDVEAKTRDGYFRIERDTVWPLVFVEELRADLLSFGLAAEFLPEQPAAAILAYNCLLRLGVHLEALWQGRKYPYGSVPFLLYSILRDIGWLRPGDEGTPLEVSSLDASELVRVMSHCCREAEELSQGEMNASSPIEAAIVASSFYRRRMSDAAVTELERIFAASLA